MSVRYLRRQELIPIAALVALFGFSFESLAGGQIKPEKPTAHTWNRIQYLGGAIGGPSKSMTWEHTFQVTPAVISLAKRGEVLFEIDPEQIASLYYAGKRYRKDASVRDAAIQGALAGGGIGAGIGALLRPLRQGEDSAPDSDRVCPAERDGKRCAVTSSQEQPQGDFPSSPRGY